MKFVVKELFSSREDCAMKKLKNRRGKIDWEERDEQIFCQVFSSLGGLCKADISNYGVRKEFRRFFRGKFACCLRQMYLCIVFMVLDLRLKEDWLSGDNQFLFYTYPLLSQIGH